MASELLQEGIYYAPGTRPGKFFGILFLRAGAGLNASDIGESFLALWKMYQDLKRGVIMDLPGHPVDAGDLSVLVGYGKNVFNLPGAKRHILSALKDYGGFLCPVPTGGGPLLRGSGLHYADDVRINAATEEIAIQFIAETQLAVNRVVVETWKLLHDMTDPVAGSPPLLLTSFYTGFQRDDRRSWIDFHDGVSNLRSQDRLGVISIKNSPTPEDKWVDGGTYLAFLRLAIDLAVWRRLSRQRQELLVGREKLSGCPVVSTTDSPATGEGNSIAQAGCPFVGTREVIDKGNETFREPPNVSDTLLRQSHVQRANHHQSPPSDSSSLRIFRQGYEFLENQDKAPGFRAGLNFVSFQDTPQRLLRMLTQEGWLGGVNFGGESKNQLPGMDRFVSVRAGGIFLVPPVVDDEPFPGSSILI